MVGSCLAPVLFFLAVDCDPMLISQDTINVGLLWQLVQSRLPASYTYYDPSGARPTRFTKDIQVWDMETSTNCDPLEEAAAYALPSKEGLCLTPRIARMDIYSPYGVDNPHLLAIAHEVAHIFQHEAYTSCHAKNIRHGHQHVMTCTHNHRAFVEEEYRLRDALVAPVVNIPISQSKPGW